MDLMFSNTDVDCYSIQTIVEVNPIDIWEPRYWIPLFTSNTPMSSVKSEMNWSTFELVAEFFMKLGSRINFGNMRKYYVFISLDLQCTGGFAIGVKFDDNGTTYVGMNDFFPEEFCCVLNYTTGKFLITDYLEEDLKILLDLDKYTEHVEIIYP